MLLKQPLQAANRLSQFDVMATVSGGGLSGQAGAVRHGISKALTYFEPELRPVLKKGGFLTRDSRVVERKKYGKMKARRSFQFSKFRRFVPFVPTRTPHCPQAARRHPDRLPTSHVADNVGGGGASKGSGWVLVIGLGVAIVLMAVAASYIANLLVRYPWITWIGLAIIVYVAVDMIFDGSREVACAAWKGVWCAPDLITLMRNLF